MLNNIKLTLIQIIIGTTLILIGYLVLKLKLQGSSLHKTQIALLRKDLEIATAKDDDNIKEKKALFNKVLKEYRNSK